MPPVSIPTSAALSPAQLLPSSHPLVLRSLQRLPCTHLLSLVSDWLDDRNQELSAPHLDPEDTGDESDLYPACQTLEELREYYAELAKKGKRLTRREVIERIVEGDWRHGISLYQLAQSDLMHLHTFPQMMVWKAYKVVRKSSHQTPPSEELSTIPRFHPSTFLANLQNEILPDVKAHYFLESSSNAPATILRILLFSSPYDSSLALIDPRDAASAAIARTMYVAFPTAAPFVYISSNQKGAVSGITTRQETLNLIALLQNAIPRAFSRPRERYELESMSLKTHGLGSLMAKCGQGRTNAAGGGWGMYAEEKTKDGKLVKDSPLEQQLPTPEPSEKEDGSSRKAGDLLGLKRKRQNLSEASLSYLKASAQSRFGNSALPNDGQGIQRLDIRIDDPFPNMPNASDFEAPPNEAQFSTNEPSNKRRKGRISDIEAEFERARINATNGSHDAIEEDTGWTPVSRMTFYGAHVFAGIRELVECGAIDAKTMPGWMTGEENVSIGVVKDGRIVGFKGSGM